MISERFRILRVLEYTGTREFIDSAIAGRSVKGSKELRTGTIREVILHEYPEHLDPLPDQFCHTLPDGECVSDDSRCMHQPKE